VLHLVSLTSHKAVLSLLICTELVPKSTCVALFALLVFGLVSYRRMMDRDRVTEEFKRETRAIRRRYRELFEAECPTMMDLQAQKRTKGEIR